MADSGVTSLAQAREAGLVARLDAGDALILRGPRGLDELVEEVLAHHDEIREVLQREAATAARLRELYNAFDAESRAQFEAGVAIAFRRPSSCATWCR